MRGGAPLRLWASELRRTSTTIDHRPLAIVAAAAQLQPTMATESGETPRRMLTNPSAPPREHNALTGGRRGDPRGDERCEAPPSIPRQLRPPADSPQPLSLRDVLSAVEVRGTSCARLDLAGDEKHKMDRGRDPID